MADADIAAAGKLSAGFADRLFKERLKPRDTLEIAVEAVIPAPKGTLSGGYLKLERRIGDFATVGVAAAVETADGSVTRAGIALTGVGGSTISATEASQALVGRPLTAESIAQAADLAAAAARPRTDHRGSAEYKRHMVRTFVVRILSRANGHHPAGAGGVVGGITRGTGPASANGEANGTSEGTA